MNAKTILEILEALVRAKKEEIEDAILEIDQKKKPYTFSSKIRKWEEWAKRLELIEKQQREEEQIQHCRMSLG